MSLPAGPDRTARRMGSGLRRVREKRYRRHSSVAQSARISRRQLAAIEDGLEQPSLATLTALLRALDCSAAEIAEQLDP